MIDGTCPFYETASRPIQLAKGRAATDWRLQYAVRPTFEFNIQILPFPDMLGVFGVNRPTLLTLVAVTMRKGEWKGSTK